MRLFIQQIPFSNFYAPTQQLSVLLNNYNPIATPHMDHLSCKAIKASCLKVLKRKRKGPETVYTYLLAREDSLDVNSYHSSDLHLVKVCILSTCTCSQWSMHSFIFSGLFINTLIQFKLIYLQFNNIFTAY